jgi:hypothetical protein
MTAFPNWKKKTNPSIRCITATKGIHLKFSCYLKIPFENRLLIIAYKAIREQDPEDPDSFYYYRNEFSFFGCHLKTGFTSN